LFSFLLCLLGFVGAYKRNTGLLRAYFTISVALIIIAFVFALVSSFSALNGVQYEEYSTSSSASESYTNSNTPQGSTATKPSSDNHKMTDYTANWNETTPTYAASEGSSYQEDYTVFIFLAIVVMVLVFFVVYLKIYSLVLAHRLRKMILLAATSLPTELPQVHEFAHANTSCAVPETEASSVPTHTMPFQQPPMFSPGFAPYPYPMMPMMSPNMGQQFPHHAMPGQQFPHHVMFGQQPVFYSYAPVPQPTPSDEKL